MNTQNVKTKVGVIAGLITLGSIGSWMDRGPNAGALNAQGGPAVTIGGPFPLPVTGTVGLSGTPNVNVANTPAVRLAEGTNVRLAPDTTVGLTQGTSILAVNPDEPGRSPYQEFQSVFMYPGGPNLADCNIGQCRAYVNFNGVPPNKRLVIKAVSVDLTGFTSDVRLGPVFLAGSMNNVASLANIYFRLTSVSTGDWVANEQVNLYVDSPRAPVVVASFDSAHLTTLGAAGKFALSGYYVSLP